MSDIRLDVSIPLDEDGFLRRQCTLCSREFKVKPTPTELRSETERSAHALLEQQSDSTAEDGGDGSESCERWCPYCGQQASPTSWWTEEQSAYLTTFARNVMTRLLNEHFIGPMKKSFGGLRSGGLVSIEFRGSELQEEEPWISPEANDMAVFPLPCCERELKVADGKEATIYCFFCGFPHSRAQA